MDYTAAEIDCRLNFLTELLSCNSNCYLWSYTPDGTLLSTNCQKLVLDTIFKRSACYGYMLEYAKSSSAPLMMSSQQGMIWGAVFEQPNGVLERIHVMGPVFSQSINRNKLERAAWDKVTPHWRPKYIRIMEELPVTSTMMFSRQILMMQYCLNEERLTVSDIVMQQEKNGGKHQEHDTVPRSVDRIQVHMSEEALLSMIRNGDVNYQNVQENAARFLNGQEQLSEDALQQAKLGQVQFIALCCHAALEGGLAAETAYNRKDAYVQDVESAKSVTEIIQIGRTMYDDYVRLVHAQRTNLRYSKAIRSTCDYIENHLNEKLDAAILAGRVGYTNYYLSRIFKKETGFSMDEYICNARMERAKLMLATTNQSIAEIAEALGFSGRNYFSVTFRKVVGMPPAAFRTKYQRL